MTKLTKKVALEAAVCAVAAAPNKEFRFAGSDEVFKAEDIMVKLTEMLAQLQKPAGEKAMTENQKQNVGYKADIENLLLDGKARTANEILNGVPVFVENKLSNQRVSSLLRQLVLDGKVKKEVVKGKSYFSVAE